MRGYFSSIRCSSLELFIELSLTRWWVVYAFAVAISAMFTIQPLPAQTFKVFDIDTTEFPKLKAKFYALDAGGKQISGFQASQFSITENGMPRNGIRVACQPVKAPAPVSIVLTIDISGSMSGNGGSEIAKSAARALIEALPSGSECAITSFDHASYINCDFTSDKKTLLRSLQTLKPQGGTDYDQAFFQQPTSALELAKTGRFKRVVVFLTDGLGGGSEVAIARIAREYKTSIFCVTVAMPAPNILKAVALRTGGIVAENVVTASQAMEAFQTMLLRAQGLKPCEVEWQSAPRCEAATQLSVRCTPSYGPAMTATASYVVPERGIVALDFTPNSLGFKSVMPSTAKEITITVAARNADFTVTGFSTTNPRFSVSPSAFVLPAGQKQQINVRFAPTDSAFVFGELRPQTSLCNSSVIYAAGGFPEKDPLVPTLRVLKPNGGEALVVGTDTTIEWTGVLPQEKVRLELSTDEGKSWSRIGKPASGLATKWYRIPNTPSLQCLVRVSQFPRWEKPVTLAGHDNGVVSSAWSPDGSRLVTISTDRTARVWDTASIFSQRKSSRPAQILAHTAPLACVAWSPDGKRILTATQDGMGKIWDAYMPVRRNDSTFEDPDEEIKPDTRPRKLLIGHKQSITSLQWNTSGTLVLTASKDGSVRLWSAETGETVKAINAHKATVYTAYLSPDEKRVLSASADKTARVWNAQTGDSIVTLTGHAGEVLSALWSPDGGRIVTLSADSTVCLWDAESGKLLRRYCAHQGAVRVASWDSSGTRIATGSDDGMVCVWNVAAYDRPPQREAEREVLSESDRIALDNFNAAMGIPRRLLLKNGIIVDSTALDVMTDHTDAIRALVWDAPRRRLFTASADQTAYSWKAEKVEELGKKVDKFDLAAEFSGHGEAITALALSPDGKRLATTSSDGLALVWKTQSTPRQNDVSDHVFSIVKPEGSANAINMGNVIVGTAYDSTVSAFVRNVGTYPLLVRDIKIGDVSAQPEFYVVSGRPPFVVPPQSAKNVEFGFKPSVLGARRASMMVITNADTLRMTILGRGVPPPLQLKAASVDMGKVQVGKSRDSLLAAWLKNTSSRPLHIYGIKQLGPTTNAFTVQTLDDKGRPEKAERFTIPPNGLRALLVRFTPTAGGKVAGSVAFEYYGFGSPALMRLAGEGGVKTFVLQGKVTDSAGRPLRAKVKYVDLDRQELLGDLKCEPDGTYAIEVGAGKRYGFYYERGGYFPASRSRDFRSMSDSGAAKTLGDSAVVFAEPEVVLRSMEEIRRSEGVLPMNNVFFDFGSAELKQESYFDLDRLAEILQQYPQQKIEIAGHTDVIGGTTTNRQLSQRRAEAVMEYLMGKGCSAKNLVSRGYGASAPIADNDSEAGRARNRRVEMRFVK
jgi:WD40 repeat protein/outer membrane protein OmpA-like peptidoglycan-associated protein